MQKNYFILFLTLHFIVVQASAQKIDYAKVRKLTITRPLNDDDSLTLKKNIQRLEALDTNQIKRHKHVYFTDLGKSYYLLAQASYKSKYQPYAYSAFKSALYHKRKDPHALWYFALWYYYHDDCEKGKIFMDSYKKHSSKEKWNTECMSYAEARCQ